MGKVQRHEQILLNELNVQKILSIENAMSILDVSESTIRRLFASMEQKGFCVRNNGQIKLLNNDFTNIYVYEHMEDTNICEKLLVATKSLKYIKSGEVIFLDGGTTIAKLCTEIAKKVQDKRLSDICVYTNSLVNFNLLKDYVRVELIGGEYRENRKDFSGPLTELVISNLFFNKCFIGTDGYVKEKGFIAKDAFSANILTKVISSSEKSYILADVGKFIKVPGMCFADNNSISGIITNDADKLRQIAHENINVI